MSAPEFRIEMVPSAGGFEVIFEHVIQSVDSEDLSTFQALGLLYHMLDKVGQFGVGATQHAERAFKSILLKEGWGERVVNSLLLAVGWQNRMYLAWSAVGREGRDAARNLNYEIYQNYWPNLDFCHAGWDAEVSDWLENHTI
ncbi:MULTISPECIES: hypothetical protein [Pseudomonas]|uniref:Uncharacterized protein n=1 Tax=Pseudomonas aegrilactucae TaxID=2854028 RepID=A0A9Q2XJ31_9PSED|nr:MULTISPECIES: hypothetical protein [Pseudomonas]MBC3410167.1 hypothetical protein [Pseudomonas sp. SWRI51]MBV6287112.1 hypothetical protein [Pseudomonas aegrilactucae]MDD2076722.1 hypothetical protein [Pseudomonas putida]WRW01880.1 hypothetical protein VPZ82_19360 [Pseudomonas putida]HDS1692673.1 hypothetical protein [Pseudomonas putida]